MWGFGVDRGASDEMSIRRGRWIKRDLRGYDSPQRFSEHKEIQDIEFHPSLYCQDEFFLGSEAEAGTRRDDLCRLILLLLLLLFPPLFDLAAGRLAPMSQVDQNKKTPNLHITRRMSCSVFCLIFSSCRSVTISAYFHLLHLYSLSAIIQLLSLLSLPVEMLGQI